MNKQIIVLLVFVIIHISSMKEEKITTSIKPENMTKVFPYDRQWCSPSAGIEPEFNPPTLLWPINKNADYSVRISLDSVFNNVVITKEGLHCAMFNPHQVLQPGMWFWQYKSGAGQWSPKSAFIIKKETPIFITPEESVILKNIPAKHPRVLVWEKNLDEFRERSRIYPEREMILKDAAKMLNNTMPDEKDATPKFTGSNEYQTQKIAKDFSNKVGNKVLENVEPVCQAYLLTGDIKYFTPIKKWVNVICDWDTEGATRKNDFADSKIMYSMALIYDTFFDQLNDTEKSSLLRAINTRAHHFYDDWINDLEAKQISNHDWQYNIYRLFMTAIAVKGVIPAADDWFSYIHEIWQARSPVLGGNDGGWVHGVSYFHINTVTLLDISAILEDLTGVNYSRDKFYKNNIQWLTYAFPPNSVNDGFADGGDTKSVPDLEILGYVDAMSRLNQDPLASWYVNKCLEETDKQLAQDPYFRWYRLRRGYKINRPQILERNDLPLAKIFPDVGMVYMHTNLNDFTKDFMVAMRSSPYGSYSHMHADQNTFNIAFGGKRLFNNTGYKLSMGDKHTVEWYKATQGHNGILINGYGEVQSDEGWGYIPRFLHGSQISYAVGDASSAYSGKTKKGDQKLGLNKFRRHILMLRPGILIIYDELKADKAIEFSWLLHSDDEIKIDRQENLVSAQNEVSTGIVTLTGSQDLELNVTDTFAIEPVKFRSQNDTEKKPNQWHFKANNKLQTKNMRFLAIIQVNPYKAKPIKVEEIGPGKYAVGDWFIEAELDVMQLAKIKVHNTDNTAGFSSKGTLILAGKKYAGPETKESTLFEIIDGEEMIKSTSDKYPASFYEAFANSSLN